MRTTPKRVADLKTDIRNTIWASGEQENLVAAHDTFFQEAFAEIAQWVKSFQDDNVNLVRFAQTFFKDGMTVLPAPRGIIRRVFTVANEDYSDPVFFRQRAWPEPETWARNLYLSPKADFTKVGALPMGFLPADILNDSLYGRARTGIWSVWQNKLYLAPWIQSNELVVVEWSGLKTQWQDNDLIPPDQHYRTAVKFFVQAAHERDYGDMQASMVFFNPNNKSGYFADALATLLQQEDERLRVRNDLIQSDTRNRLCSELADDFPIDDTTGQVIAHLGNASTPGIILNAVGELVRNWGPGAITGARFATTLQNNYDLTAGDQFHEFLAPYAGSLGEGGKSNGFWPAPAAADYGISPTLDNFKAFFNNPAGASYFSVVIGNVQLFVLDTSSSNAGGITAGGVQGSWLQGALAISTAPWKIVVMDQAPYGSIASNATLQWPFASWGADMVIASATPTYERLEISGLPVIIDGLGGDQVPVAVTNPISTSVAAYAEAFGAGKLTAKSTSLVWEFWNADGQIVDILELAKS